MNDDAVDAIANAMTRVCWQGHLTFNDYRRMAQAAIDALQLAEQRGSFNDDGYHDAHGVRIMRRLVTPWVDL